jgi:hypothetical protein
MLLIVNPERAKSDACAPGQKHDLSWARPDTAHVIQ